MNKYLISGIGPSKGGTGRLISYIIPIAKKYNYEIVIKPALNRESITYLLKKRKYLRIIIEVLFRTLIRLKFIYKIYSIKNSNVILFHPQILGYSIFFRIVKKNKIVKNFILEILKEHI